MGKHCGLWWGVGVLSGVALGGYLGRNWEHTRAEGMRGFPRRYYRSLAQLREDVRFMQEHRERVREALRVLSPAFRERLMLAVTQVNACRYCAQYHSRLALEGGLSQAEVEALLAGDFDDCPSEEHTAILYAQHWAETEGRPDPEARAALLACYGEAQAQAIDAALHMIKAGNYMGNTLDYFRYRLSGGRVGA